MKEILVSVVVISYNAEKFIAETLDSIADQTFDNLELIISDDGSKDNTVAVVKEWKDKHLERFAKIEIQSSTTNQGTVKNANSGLKLCNGKYTKLIAADDKLVPDCIEILVRECETKKYPILLGRMSSFYKGNDLEAMDFNEDFYKKSAQEQYRQLLEVNMCFAPTALYSSTFLKEMNYFDERYPLMEDYPFWLKVTKAGIKLPAVDQVVALYRRNDQSVTSTTGDKIVGVGYFKTYKRFFYQQKMIPLLKCRKYRIVVREIKEFIYKDLILMFGNKRGSKASNRLYHIFYG